MKHSLIASLVFVASSSLLYSEVEVQLVQMSANADLPRSVPREVQPNNTQSAATLSFLIKAENLVSLDKDSLKIETGGKWKVGFFNKVSDDGQYALLNISTDQEVIGKLDALELSGSIKAVTGKETKTETVTLTEGAKPTTVGDFTLSYKGEKKEEKGSILGFSMGGPGIKVKGKFGSIKSIAVTVDGKEVDTNGNSTFNKSRTYYFDELTGDTAEVTFTYWTDLSEITVPIKK